MGSLGQGVGGGGGETTNGWIHPSSLSPKFSDFSSGLFLCCSKVVPADVLRCLGFLQYAFD